MLEKMNKKLKYPYQLKTSMKRVVSRFLEMKLETKNWKANVIVTPTRVNETYLEPAKLLGMKPLRKNMTLTQFRSTTKLGLKKNLK